MIQERIIFLKQYLLFKIQFSFVRFVLNARNYVTDLYYYGYSLGGTVGPTTQHSYRTESSDYRALPLLFSKLCIDKSDVIVDVGCGKGRVLMWLIKNNYLNKLIGIELNKEVAGKTSKRLNRYDNITIIAGDILQNIPADATIFYLFNPFDEKTMVAFKQLLAIKENVTVVYYNALHLSVFKNDNQWKITEYFIPTVGKWGCRSAIITKLTNSLTKN